MSEWNDTLELQEREGEKDRLVPRPPLEELFDDEEEEELLPRPEEEAAEADCLPPFTKERLDKSLICESSFTWVRDSLMMSSANNEDVEGVDKACLTEA